MSRQHADLDVLELNFHRAAGVDLYCDQPVAGDVGNFLAVDDGGDAVEVERDPVSHRTETVFTPATKIRTNPYSRFGPATADRGSRGSEINHGIHRNTRKESLTVTDFGGQSMKPRESKPPQVSAMASLDFGE